MATTQDNRTLQLSTPLGKDYLLAERFSCEEGLNQLFRIELDLLHEEEHEGFTSTKIEPNDVVGNAMALVVVQAEDVERHFHGICNRFSQGGRNGRFSGYRAELVPSVWFLTQISQSRIFQNKSVPDILSTILSGYSMKKELQNNYEPRHYCVQYRESDWNFISRLMEEEGIFYYFEHTEGNHELILADTSQSHRPCPKLSKIFYDVKRPDGSLEWIPVIDRWTVDSNVRTGKHELRDYNYLLPVSSLDIDRTSVSTIGPNKSLEVYDWPGGYAKRYNEEETISKVYPDREHSIKVRQEEVEVGYKQFYGSGNCGTLTSGFKFELQEHPNSEDNGDYVVVAARHEAAQSPTYISDQPDIDGYKADFTALTFGTPYRPPRLTQRPVVHGSQTAFVVGPGGEEIFTDKFGRVKVQFHWDREGQMNQGSSCWLRVAQTWASNGWGSMHLPRIGMEVLVNFLEGDPDQPIISGCVYNAGNMPPYTLPDEQTKSTMKTNSTKGGGGFNEFRIEDKKGSEQIFLHAEKDQDIRVKNNCMETIMRDRHLIVENEQFELVKKDKHLHVKYNHNELIEGTMSLKVNVDLQEKVGINYALDAGVNVHIKAGTSAVIEAGTSLTLKVGGNFVNISQAGVAIKGTMVMINSGGAAGSGAGSSPEAPKEAKEADKADAGRRVQQKQNPGPPQRPNWSAILASIDAVVIPDTVPSPPGGHPHAAQAEAADHRADAAQQAAQLQAAANNAPPPAPMDPNEDPSSPSAPVPANYTDPAEAIASYIQSSRRGTPFIHN